MHVIDRQDNFTLIGSHARHGKLTLFDAEGPRDRGALKHVGLRVSSLDGTGSRSRSPTTSRSGSSRPRPRWSTTSTTSRCYTADPEATAEAYLDYGFASAEPRDGVPRVEVGGAYVEFHRGDPGDTTGRCSTTLRCSSIRRRTTSATPRRSASRSSVSSTRRTRYAVFVWGPDRVRIEYVEHKPSFSLT